MIAGALFGSDDHIAFILYLLAYLLAAVPIAGNAIQELSHGRFFSEYPLMLVVSLGAFLLHHRPEAAIVLILHGVGKIASDFILAGAEQRNATAGKLHTGKSGCRQYERRRAHGQSGRGPNR